MSKQLELGIKAIIEFWIMRAKRNTKSGNRTTIMLGPLENLLELFENYTYYHKGYEC